MIRGILFLLLVFSSCLATIRAQVKQAPGLVYSFPFNAEIRQQPPKDVALDENGFLWLLNDQHMFLFAQEKFMKIRTAESTERFEGFIRVDGKLAVKSTSEIKAVISGDKLLVDQGLLQEDVVPNDDDQISVTTSSSGSVHTLLNDGRLISNRNGDTTIITVTTPSGEGLFGLRIGHDSKCISDASDNVWITGRNGVSLVLKRPILERQRLKENVGTTRGVVENPSIDRLLVYGPRGVFIYVLSTLELLAHFSADQNGRRIAPFKIVESNGRHFLYSITGVHEVTLEEPTVSVLVDPKNVAGRINEKARLNCISKDPSSETLYMGTKDNEFITYDIRTGREHLVTVLPESDSRPYNLVYEIACFSDGNAVVHGEAGIFYLNKESMTFTMAQERWPNFEWSPWFNPSGVQVIADSLIFVPAFNDNMLIYNVNKDSIYGPTNARERKFHISDSYWDGQNYMYCSSKEGVILYDIRKNIVDVYGGRHGFDNQSQYYRYMSKGEDGTMYIGTPRGYFKVNAASLSKGDASSSFFTDLRVNGKTYSAEAYLPSGFELNLDHTENTITMRRINPQYAPMNFLERTIRVDDGPWLWENPNTLIQYTGLLPGTRSVQELTRAGEVVELMTFQIALPLWKRLWVQALLTCIVLALLYWMYQRRLASVRAEERIRYTYDEQIRELEIRSLRQQMDPHFIFNSLNSIKSYIADNEPSIAISYLNKFAQLIRLILGNSSKPLVDLGSELKALELFIELEQLRFDNSFTFSIDIPKDIDLQGIEVPPTIFQPYVENAIWHGLMQKEGERKLHILIREDGDDLVAFITDNGIGRKAAGAMVKKMTKQHKSLGMKITEERIMKGIAGVPGRVSITDLYDDQSIATGTSVNIQLPINPHYGKEESDHH